MAWISRDVDMSSRLGMNLRANSRPLVSSPSQTSAKPPLPNGWRSLHPGYGSMPTCNGMVLGIAFLASQVALAHGADAVTADEQSELRQKALSLNDITGDDPIEGQVKDLVADPAGTKKLLAVAVKMAKEKEQPFNFNGA